MKKIMHHPTSIIYFILTLLQFTMIGCIVQFFLSPLLFMQDFSPELDIFLSDTTICSSPIQEPLHKTCQRGIKSADRTCQ